jgi:hypothetical protein
MVSYRIQKDNLQLKEPYEAIFEHPRELPLVGIVRHLTLTNEPDLVSRAFYSPNVSRIAPVGFDRARALAPDAKLSHCPLTSDKIP